MKFLTHGPQSSWLPEQSMILFFLYSYLLLTPSSARDKGEASEAHISGGKFKRMSKNSVNKINILMQYFSN